MTHRAPGPMPKVGADAGPRASAAEGRAARRLIAGLLLAAAALDLARCGLVMATARHPAPAAGLITAGLAAAVLSSWTARGHLRGRRWPAWAAVLIGTASAPQAAAAGFGAPYTIPDTATAVLGILLAVTVLATVGGSRPGQHTENPCAVNRECHRPGAQPPASRRNPGRMADPGGRRQVLPAPAEGRLLPQSRLGTLPPDRPPAVPGHPARPPGPEQPAPAVHLRRGTRRQRPVPVPLPRRQPPPAEQLRPPRVPARLRRAMRAGRPAAAPDRHRRRHHLTRRPARHLACRHTGRRGPEQSGGLRSAARARNPDHSGRHSGGLLVSASARPVLAEQRLGHEVPGMRGLYTHVSDRMRETLVKALQARWEDSLRARAAIRPTPPSPCSTNCWHPTAATRRTQAPPSAPSGTWQPAPPLGGREKLISQIPPKQPEGPVP